MNFTNYPRLGEEDKMAEADSLIHEATQMSRLEIARLPKYVRLEIVTQIRKKLECMRILRNLLYPVEIELESANWIKTCVRGEDVEAGKDIVHGVLVSPRTGRIPVGDSGRDE